MVNTYIFVVKFAHDINLISEELRWRLNIILNSITLIAAAIHFALIWSRFCPYYVTIVPVLRTQWSRLCPYYALFCLTLFSALLRTQRTLILPTYTLKPILRKKLFIGYQQVGYLIALTIINCDWPRLILISVFVHAYMQIYVFIIYIFFSGYSWVKRLAETENGCHQSMWNTLFKPFRSDCDMTRFRAYQTLIYIIWALCFTPISLFSEFRKMYLEYFESLCHKWLNEFFQNISTFKSHLFWLFKKQSLQYDRVQCNIAELCVQIVENNMIILCYVHQLDSPRTVITNFKKRTTEDCAYFMRCHVL